LLAYRRPPVPAFTPELLLPSLAPLSDAKIGWIAYSGGMDSTVLLHALAAVRDRLSFEIRALHLDHGLHADSPTWAAHCARTCARLAVPFETRRLDVAQVPGESLEALARQARYQTMAGLLGTGDLLLTAQHRDDQAETLLLALMRGSGPAGLAAMPRMAPLGAGRLVRPLLGHSRTDLLDYARSRNLDWLEDPANRSLRFDRNFLRHQVLPLLAERWPSCSKAIARSAAHCAEAQGIIEHLAADQLPEVAGRSPGTLSIARLGSLDLPLRKLVLRRWLREHALPPPDSRHLDRILSEVLSARADADPLVSWPGCEVRRYRDDLFAMAPLPPVPAPGSIHWDRGALPLPSALGHLELRAATEQRLDPLDLFADGLEVRFGVKGLFCRTARGRHRRPLKKLYQEAGVPPWVRPYVPLLFAATDLIAVGDFWVCCLDGMAQKFRIRWEPDPKEWSPLDLVRV
jgi:tRNA(Ile)-lysidine synthase